VQDRLGHEIYLTDERWHHICEAHPEKCSVTEGGFWRRCAEGGGFRIQLGLMCIFIYRDYSDLPHGNTTLVVVVRFGFDHAGAENNFILTAYQMRRHRREGR